MTLPVSAIRIGGPERAPQQNNANAPAAPPKEDSKGKDESLKLRLDLNLYVSTLYLSLDMSDSSPVFVLRDVWVELKAKVHGDVTLSLL